MRFYDNYVIGIVILILFAVLFRPQVVYGSSIPPNYYNVYNRAKLVTYHGNHQG